MLSKLLDFLRRKSRPLNTIEISKKALVSNFNYLSSLNPKIRLAPVLKSNAYGHGIEIVGKIIDQLNPSFICVDSLYEAFLLKKKNITSPILIMGYIDPGNLKRKQLNFEYSVFDPRQIEVLDKYQKGAKVHIFLDTGMHREGIIPDDLPEFLDQIKGFTNIEITGVMSHLALTDNIDNPLFKEQIKEFKRGIKILNENSIFPKWVHIGASGALINKEALKVISQTSNLIRIGKSLYGISPHLKDSNLTPVLKFSTKIAQIKKLKKGGRVGYDGTYIAKKDISMAVLPVGYNDGLDRRLSNKGVVLVDNKKCPIIGRVSMNITTVDISNIDNPFVGQEAVIYSNNPEDINSLEQSARLADTIAYELMVHLHPSIKRILV